MVTKFEHHYWFCEIFDPLSEWNHYDWIVALHWMKRFGPIGGDWI